MIPHGWWEGPAAGTTGVWKWHDAPMLPIDGGGVPVRAANMHVIDLDLDGDNDVLMSSAHAYGIWWFETPAATRSPRSNNISLISHSHRPTLLNLST